MLKSVSRISIILLMILFSPSIIGVNALTYVSQGQLVHTLPSGGDLFSTGSVMGIAYDPNTRTYWSISSGSAGLNIYQQNSNGSFLVKGNVNLNGRGIVYRSQDGKIYIRNAGSGLYSLNQPFTGLTTQVLPSITFQSSSSAFTFANGGNVFDYYNGVVREYNFTTGAQIRSFSLNPLFPSYNVAPYSYKIASNGTHLYFLSSPDIVYVYDINGVFITKISLNHPSLDASNAPYSFSYANGRIYVDDTTVNIDRWFGYEITPNPNEWPMSHDDLTRSGYSSSASPQTSQLQWKSNVTIQYGGPVVANGRVYLGSPDSKVYCLNQSTGKQIWNYTTGGIIYSTPAFANGRVYVGSTDHKVYCLNAYTGASIWNFTTNGVLYSSPAIADGKAYVGSVGNVFYCLNVSTGFQIWTYNVTSGAGVRGSSPAIAGGMVIFGAYDQRIYALNMFTGKQIWNYTTTGNIWAQPVVADDKVYVGTADYKIYCLNQLNGVSIWNYTTAGSLFSSPAVAYGRVYIGSADRKMYCLNQSTGKSMWNYTTSGQIYVSSAAVAGNRVYVGSDDYKVYCFNAYTGALIWNYTTGSSVQSSPAVAGGMVFVGSLDGKLYAFGDYAVIKGNVTDRSTRAPISGATVIMDSNRTTTTAANGSYIFANVTAGTRNVMVSKSGYFSNSTLLTLSPGEVRVINCTMVRLLATISGSITDKVTGGSIIGATVKIDSQQTTTGVNGTYSLMVAAGTYILNSSKAGYYWNTTSITVIAGEFRTVNLKIIKLAIVNGTVLDANTGNPLAGATVSINPTVTTGSDGKYSFQVLPGNYVLTVSKGGYVVSSFPIAAVSGQIYTNIFQMLQFVVVSGLVTNLKTGASIQGATVTLGSNSTTTGSNGSYSLMVAPGTYTLTVSKTGFATNTSQLTGTSGQAITRNIAIREPFGIIRGVVTDSDTGSFIVGAIVKWDSQQTTTASNGSYILNLDAGTYTITVSKDGFDVKTSQVALSAGVTQTANFALLKAAFPIIPLIAGIGVVAVVAVVMLLKMRKPTPKPKILKPAALRMKAEPTEILSDGRSTSAITLELLDEGGQPIQALDNVEVTLSTTRGKISSPIVIKKGESTIKATLTSSKEFGTAKITATARGLKTADTNIEFLEKRRFCMHCGTRMSLDSNICPNPKCGKSPPSGVDVKICPNCGEVIPSVAKFCSNCGAGQA